MLLKTFCSHTNLHGFIYIVQPSRYKIEKIFWLISVLISFILTGILIHKLVIESQKNPVVIYTDQNPIRVQDLNFPAISMCFGLLYRTFCRTILDYPEVKKILRQDKSKINRLTPRQLKLLQVLTLVSRDRFISDNFPGLKIPTDDFLEILENFNETLMKKPGYDMSPTWYGSWNTNFHMDLTKVLSDFGNCFTFNMANIDKIYTNKS